jgi:voltage-gated sodium channel
MDDSDWHLALDVRLLQGRKFKAQTLIVTDRVMAITGAGDAQEQLQLQDQHFDDMIPLCEIRGVQSLSEPFRAEGSWHHNRAMIAIHTKQEGANSGRKYLFQAQSARFLDHRANLQIVSRTWSNMEELETLVDVLQDLVKKAIEAESEKDKSWLMLFERSREAMRALFESNGLQMFIAFLIVANFAVNAFEAQMTGKLENDDGSPGNTAKVLEKIDIAFTVVFTIELAGNLYAHLFWDFVTDGWCLFDFVIVAVSLLNPLMPEGQGSMIKLFRLLRAFRVLRIFGRVGSIRSIVNALIKSLVPVLNAFFIMFIVLALYAIIGVTIFGESAPDDFGNLSLGIISLFRIAAGETWIESVDVADEEGNVNWGTGGFVMSYILIINWTLLQVGMAVLLDTFVSETSREQEEAFKKLLSARRIRDTMGNVLDPFLRMVSMPASVPLLLPSCCTFIPDTRAK